MSNKSLYQGYNYEVGSTKLSSERGIKTRERERVGERERGPSIVWAVAGSEQPLVERDDLVTSGAQKRLLQWQLKHSPCSNALICKQSDIFCIYMQNHCYWRQIACCLFAEVTPLCLIYVRQVHLLLCWIYTRTNKAYHVFLVYSRISCTLVQHVK